MEGSKAAHKLLAEVVEGLSQPQKRLSPKFFYDEKGSGLFDQITELDEYYLTRTELSIMAEHAAAITEALGPRCLLIEYGSGSNRKIRLLLDMLKDPAGYVPIDVSGEYLMTSAKELEQDYPDLRIMPVAADFTKDFALPEIEDSVDKQVAYFPGSTIGNFGKAEAVNLLSQMKRVTGPGGGILIGVDLHKDPEKLHAAYNDARGVTAAFNLNMLDHINRELGADFDTSQFEHRAFFNADHSRVEMHLLSKANQVVTVGNRKFSFAAGETILTEYSYKHTVEAFRTLASSAGLTQSRVWTDSDELFSLQYLTPASEN